MFFEPGTKLGTDPKVVFARAETPPSKRKEMKHTTYISMLKKLPAPKKVIENLQQKLSKLVYMLHRCTKKSSYPPLTKIRECKSSQPAHKFQKV